MEPNQVAEPLSFWMLLGIAAAWAFLVAMLFAHHRDVKLGYVRLAFNRFEWAPKNVEPYFGPIKIHRVTKEQRPLFFAFLKWMYYIILGMLVFIMSMSLMTCIVYYIFQWPF